MARTLFVHTGVAAAASPPKDEPSGPFGEPALRLRREGAVQPPVRLTAALREEQYL
jgi:hypothetical protein